jgi:hypothetical protein
VTAPAPIPVASVAVSPGSATLNVGATTQLSATTLDANNNVLSGRFVSWTSSNNAISKVSTTGLVTAVAAGTATITAASEGQTSSAAITVNAPAPVPVASVTVSPPTSSLQVGATVQLSATMRDASGNILNGRAVVWSSSDSALASVSGNGLVTTLNAGNAQITATSELKSGSASVAISNPPPPPPPGSTNEPTGMTLIDERPFNSLAEHASPHVPAWDTDASLSIITDNSAPKSASSVMRASFPTGFPGGTSSGHAGVPFGGRRVLYINYWAKYSANWWGHLTGVNKQVYVFANGKNIVFFEATGVGTAPLQPRIVTQGTPNDQTYTPNLVPSAVIPRGQWFNVEIVLTGNSSGAADGSVDWWVNGVHVGSRTSVAFTSGATLWDTFEIRPVWGGLNDVVPATQTLDWDNIYLSGKN